jgi:hypothetical protein
VFIGSLWVIGRERMDFSQYQVAKFRCDQRQKTGAKALLFAHAKIPAIALVDESASTIRTPFHDEFRLILNNQTVARFAPADLLRANAIPSQDQPEHSDDRQPKQYDNQRDDNNLRFQRRSSF